MTRPVVFVHTDDAQLLPALVAVHSLRSRGGAGFDVELLRLEGTELDARSDGRPYRAHGPAIWDHRRAWSFHYLRRRVPELMGYTGRALAIDPDVFALRSIVPLLERDMGGKAIHCRHLAEGYAGDGRPVYSSGVMLLDCAKLTSWQWRKELDDLFAGKVDYFDMLSLLGEDPASIGALEPCWNSFDELDADTGLLHLTRLSTQPWATGLVLAHDRYDPSAPIPTASWWQRMLGIVPQRRCRPHPDPRQERLFFELLAECLAEGALPEAYLRAEIARGRLRRDAFTLIARIDRGAGRSRGAALLDELGIEARVAPRDGV